MLCRERTVDCDFAGAKLWILVRDDRLTLNFAADVPAPRKRKRCQGARAIVSIERGPVQCAGKGLRAAATATWGARDGCI